MKMVVKLTEIVIEMTMREKGTIAIAAIAKMTRRIMKTRTAIVTGAGVTEMRKSTILKQEILTIITTTAVTGTASLFWKLNSTSKHFKICTTTNDCFLRFWSVISNAFNERISPSDLYQILTYIIGMN
jgi:hypothetical protein